jgi:hypothetical protein
LTAGVGDLMHPAASPDPRTYQLIGETYEYLERCEPYTIGGEHRVAASRSLAEVNRKVISEQASDRCEWGTLLQER